MKSAEELRAEIAELEAGIAASEGGAAVTARSERLAYARAELRLAQLPAPKYIMGEKVWAYETFRDTELLPCPDCLDTRKWSVTFPSGQVEEVPCQRCSSAYHGNNMPPRPTRVVFNVTTKQLTIGKISVTTKPNWESDDPVQYMCHETGVGSGSIYSERNLFATQEDAQTAGYITAAEQTRKIQEQPEQKMIMKLSGLPLNTAIMKETWNSRWNVWYAYRRLREEVEDALKDHPNKDLSEIIAWETNHRDLPEIEAAMQRLKEIAADNPFIPGLAEIVATFEAPVVEMKAEAREAAHG
jgi:hypothetical protein